MTISDLLSMCLREGVRLSVSDGSLRVHFEREPQDAALLALLREHKQELLRHLNRASAPAPSGIPLLPALERTDVSASPAQRRMWLLDRLENAGAAYNMVGVYRLHGRFDRAAMQAALNEVVVRHEALRTVLADRHGELRQLIQAPSAVPFDGVDASTYSLEQRADALMHVLERENCWLFDLSASPLLRASCIAMDQDEWVLILNVHHIACDGWSIELLEREISALYAAAVAKEAWPAPLSRVEYADYVAWNKDFSDDAAWRAQLPYWVKTLEGMPSQHGVPLDKPRASVPSYRGGTIRRTMSAAWLQQALAHCQDTGATLFMFLHAALAAVLCVYSNERDIVMGFPVAGRNHRDIENTVGLFVNTLVLRSRLENNPSFADMLAASRQSIVDALAHQDVPYDAVTNALRAELGHSALTQILLVMRNSSVCHLRLPGADVEVGTNADAPIKFDLQVEAEQSADALIIDWRFNRSLFDETSMARMVDCLVHLLDAAAQQPGQPVFSLVRAAPPLAETTGHSAPKSFLRIEAQFEAHAATHANRLAVVLDGNALTYAELNQRADVVAALLRGRGITRGMPVGLCTLRSLEAIVGMLGVLKAGGAYVPLDPAYPMARLGMILDDCAADVVLTQKALAAQLVGLGLPLVVLDEPLPPPQKEGDQSAQAAGNADDPAYVIYTSGTTGTPKGVVVAHTSVANLLEHFDVSSPPTEPWSGSLWSSISFDVSVYEIFSVLCNGGTLHLVPDRVRHDPEPFFRWLDDGAIASTYMHAGYLEPLLQHVANGEAGLHLRRMLVGVEPIASDQLYALAQRLPQLDIINGYGPTETTVCCTTYRFDPARHVAGTRVPIGLAVTGLTLHVMNAGGEPAPYGAVGELYVGGVGVALGYLNNPALSDARFVAMPIHGVSHRVYRTGDLVRYRADGELEFVGRADEQIKIRGFRIEPAEIEVRLCQQRAVSDAVVVALGDGMGRRLVAYVVPKKEHAAKALESDSFAAQVKRELRHHLPAYMIPDDVVPIAEIPLTVNGKVNRAALPAVIRTRAGAERIAPRNDIECRIADIWKEVLNIDDVGVHDDFFALGGQSLLAMRLIGRVRQVFQLGEADLPFATLFENPTIETFAEVMAGAAKHERMRRQEDYLAALLDNVEEGTL